MKLTIIILTTFLVCTSATIPQKEHHAAEMTYGKCGKYIAHPHFKKIMYNPKYACWGRPAGIPRIRICNLKGCNRKYVQQYFCKDGDITANFYYQRNRCKSWRNKTGYHSNLNIGDAEPCYCPDEDGLNISSF